MFLDAYIGRLDDPKFVANRYEPSGSVPGAVGPLFPHGRHAFDELVARIEDGRLPGGPTQHIAYVAPASKSQIETFFREVCLTNHCSRRGPRRRICASRCWNSKHSSQSSTTTASGR